MPTPLPDEDVTTSPAVVETKPTPGGLSASVKH
jgi:hypothetical protein